MPEPGAGSGTAANIKGSVTRSRDNYLENRRKLNGVSAEMSLNVLAYNLKRVMKIMGTEGLLKAMTA